MTSPTTFSVVSWIDPQDREPTDPRWTRAYGTAPTRQAAIRLAEEFLAAGTDYIVVTATETVHFGRTPSRQSSSPRRR